VSERANTITDDAKAKYEEGKQWAGETADSLKSTLNEKTTALKTTATETVSTVEESFKRGVEKAKTKANTTKA
jgi:gas vesicle protein